ncbi:MAG TPA: hypothetical protein DCW47_02905, partial [Lachnospiraceae bacterium]|nr:hypothetical protein [Lachnospiraceae bacterium]
DSIANLRCSTHIATVAKKRILRRGQWSRGSVNKKATSLYDGSDVRSRKPFQGQEDDGQQTTRANT